MPWLRQVLLFLTVTTTIQHETQKRSLIDVISRLFPTSHSDHDLPKFSKDSHLLSKEKRNVGSSEYQRNKNWIYEKILQIYLKELMKRRKDLQSPQVNLLKRNVDDENVLTPSDIESHAKEAAVSEAQQKLWKNPFFRSYFNVGMDSLADANGFYKKKKRRQRLKRFLGSKGLKSFPKRFRLPAMKKFYERQQSPNFPVDEPQKRFFSPSFENYLLLKDKNQRSKRMLPLDVAMELSGNSPLEEEDKRWFLPSRDDIPTRENSLKSAHGFRKRFFHGEDDKEFHTLAFPGNMKKRFFLPSFDNENSHENVAYPGNMKKRFFLPSFENENSHENVAYPGNMKKRFFLPMDDEEWTEEWPEDDSPYVFDKRFSLPGGELIDLTPYQMDLHDQEKRSFRGPIDLTESIMNHKHEPGKHQFFQIPEFDSSKQKRFGYLKKMFSKTPRHPMYDPRFSYFQKRNVRGLYDYGRSRFTQSFNDRYSRHRRNRWKNVYNPYRVEKAAKIYTPQTPETPTQMYTNDPINRFNPYGGMLAPIVSYAPSFASGFNQFMKRSEEGPYPESEPMVERGGVYPYPEYLEGRVIEHPDEPTESNFFGGVHPAYRNYTTDSKFHVKFHFVSKFSSPFRING